MFGVEFVRAGKLALVGDRGQIPSRCRVVINHLFGEFLIVVVVCPVAGKFSEFDFGEPSRRQNWQIAGLVCWSDAVAFT